MSNSNKSVWAIIILVVLGGVFLLLATKPNTVSSEKVTMENVVTQPVASIPAKSLENQKDPVPSPAIVTSPDHGVEAGFAVQVYSFKDQKRANTALDNLKKNGYSNSYIEISDLGVKGTWYRVRIGGLKDETQATEMLESIRKNFNSGILVKSK